MSAELGVSCSRHKTLRRVLGVERSALSSGGIVGLLDAGLIEIGDGKLRLTEEGLLVADAVMAKFF